MKFQAGQKVICVTRITGLYSTTDGGMGIDLNNPKVKEVVTIADVDTHNRVLIKEYLFCTQGYLQSFRKEYFKPLDEFFAEEVEKELQELEL